MEPNMTTAIDPKRRFQLWEYHVSHGIVLIRSPRESDETHNLDIMFFGVEYLAIPRHLEEVIIEPGSKEDWNHANRLLKRNIEHHRVWAIVSLGVRHLIVAAKIDVRETKTDIFDSPFNKTEPT